MLSEQESFLKNDVTPLLRSLSSDRAAKWGKMDAQQMVEHLREVCKLANGKIVLPLLNTNPEMLAAARAFVFSAEAFSKNIRVPVMPEEPRPHKYKSLEEAIDKTIPELFDVFTVYASDPDKKLMHPIFGELCYPEQIHYLDKHIRHHLRQFGLIN